jgi:hypothetical protein
VPVDAHKILAASGVRDELVFPLPGPESFTVGTGMHDEKQIAIRNASERKVAIAFARGGFRDYWTIISAKPRITGSTWRNYSAQVTRRLPLAKRSGNERLNRRPLSSSTI